MNTVTLDLKRYEELLQYEKAINERKVICEGTAYYGGSFRYLIDSETELTKQFQSDINEIDKKYKELKSKYRECRLELSKCKTNWFSKLFKI